jgi:hypothetical protein
LLPARNKQIFPGLPSIRLHQEQAESKTKRSQGIDGRLFAADLPPCCRQFTAVWPPFGRAVVLL